MPRRMSSGVLAGNLYPAVREVPGQTPGRCAADHTPAPGATRTSGAGKCPGADGRSEGAFWDGFSGRASATASRCGGHID